MRGRRFNDLHKPFYMKPDGTSSNSDNYWERRQFIKTVSKVAGASLFFQAPFISNAISRNYEEWTVGKIMDLFIKEIPGAPFQNTVDTLKSGSRNTKVTGIVTTMFPTVEVINESIKAGANFIIAHEPSFYNHQDETNWLKNDEVYEYKAGLLKKHNIAIWRNHDYIHSYKPDGVQSAVVTQLGWATYQDKEERSRINIPATSLQALIQQIKQRLDIEMVRYIGDLKQSCSKLLLLPGAYGGKRQIEAIGKHKPDTVIVGELQEWETAEYVRDARTKGMNLSLIIMGHSVSEEPGAAFMESWLKQHVPGVPVKHIPSGNPLSFL